MHRDLAILDGLSRNLLIVLMLSSGLYGCGTITIPATPVGTAPSVSLRAEADQGGQQVLLGSASCELRFGEFENPIVVIATGEDSDEAVRKIRLDGEISFSCGVGDSILGLTDTIDEEIVDAAVPGEQGRVLRNALRLISFRELNDMCIAQSTGFLDVSNVNLRVRGEAENFHGQTAATPVAKCILVFALGLIPPP